MSILLELVLLDFLGKKIGSHFNLVLELMSSEFAGSVRTSVWKKDIKFDHIRITPQILLKILSFAKIPCNVLGKIEENIEAKDNY